MRMLLTLCLLTATVPCQAQYSSTGPFGRLYEDELLQRELKLTKDQIKRMTEIHLQSMRIYDALLTSKVRQEIGISRTQLSRIRRLRAGLRRKIRDFMRNNPPSGPADIPKINDASEKIKDQLDREALKALTGIQRSKFKQLLGKPYKPKSKPDV